MKDRVIAVLDKVGLKNILDHDSDLENYGLTSLTLALLIMALNKEFAINIPVLPIEKEKFTSINTLTDYLNELGAK